jgi:hypothetical protein
MDSTLSSSRVPALQAGSPDFKTQPLKNKKTNKQKKKLICTCHDMTQPQQLIQELS